METPNTLTVSVIIPVYNERETIQELLRRVMESRHHQEVVIVDDGSTDGTVELLREFETVVSSGRSQASDPFRGRSPVHTNVRIIYHAHNAGKGAALQRGFQEACGDVLIVQDADLEYDPRDYARLLAPLVDNQADVVYGSRFLSRVQPPWTLFGYYGNSLITAMSNWFTGLRLTDVWTGYKVLRREALRTLSLQEPGFEMEIELTSKLAQQGWRIQEVPISYMPRTKAQGKKITWRDGLKAFRCMMHYRSSTAPRSVESV